MRIEADDFTPVTSKNYARAETQSLFAGAYISLIAKSTCTPGMGVLMHEREPSDPSHRAFARVNYDTLYSWLLLDLTTPATISMPETDGRYQSAQVLNEGHWMPFVITEPGEMVFTDRWNKEEILTLRKELQILRDEKGYKSEDMFGKEGEIDFDMNNVGVAIGWGGQPKEGAVYLFYTPDSDEHQTLTMSNVPHADNAFWSITVYDEDGFVASEPFNMNSSFAKTNADGDTVLNFGGDPSADNYLPVYPGWNATLRIYTPQPNYFDGSWVRPELQPAD